jgi:arylsulfatase A-like enzyme
MAKPNFLFIICHDLGRRLGCYGEGVPTPNLDRVAAEGVRFDNAFCSAAQCSPSRSSIMTGRSPHANGLMGLAHCGWEINPDQKKLPQYLRELGYQAHLFGVQHESSHPESLGYDAVHRFPKDARPTVAGVEAWLRRHAKEKNPQPFYLSVGFYEPHRPYPETDIEYPLPAPGETWLPPYLPERPGIRRDLSGLDALIRRVDACVGRLADVLDETGLRDNTWLIFTTDHGIAMPRAKGTCYDPGVGVALLVRAPNLSGGRRVCSELIPNTDLLPTFVEAAGGSAPTDIEGRSFLPLLRGANYAAREHVFLEMSWHDRYNPMRAVRTAEFKYIRNWGRRPPVYVPADIFVAPAGMEVRDEYYRGVRAAEELYDLKNDPLEMRNVVAAPACAATLTRLRALLADWMRSTRDPLLDGDVPAPAQQWFREWAATVRL